MKLLIYLVLTSTLLTVISSCSNVQTESVFEFSTEATRQSGEDELGNYEDYTIRNTKVRFYSAKVPSDLQFWDGFGSDGGFPLEVLTKVSIKSELGAYELPLSLIKDLGDPNIRQRRGYDYVRLQLEGENLRIAMLNSDGAGSYRVLFLIDLKNARAKRYIRDYLEPAFTQTHNWTPLNIKNHSIGTPTS